MIDIECWSLRQPEPMSIMNVAAVIGTPLLP